MSRHRLDEFSLRLFTDWDSCTRAPLIRNECRRTGVRRERGEKANASGVSCAPVQALHDISKLHLSGRGYLRSSLRDSFTPSLCGESVLNVKTPTCACI